MTASSLVRVSVVISGGRVGFADPTQEILCALIRATTRSAACHVLLMLQGAFDDCESCALEDGYSGLDDPVARRGPRLGSQLSPWDLRRERLPVGSYEERLVGVVPRNTILRAYEQLRDAAYSLDPRNMLTLLARGYRSAPKELVCSTFAAVFLVAVGCLSAGNATYNALPSDFSNFTYTCKDVPFISV